jgi:hypothetical protein
VYYVRTTPGKVASRPNVETPTITLDELRTIEPYWWTDGMVQGRVLLDKTGGELTEILARLGAAQDASAPYDAYLNALVRGKAASRRGDELGARLHAADSVRYLAKALAALEGRRPRFHDRLAGALGDWEPRLLAILRDPSVEAPAGAVRGGPRSDGVARGANARFLARGATSLTSRRPLGPWLQQRPSEIVEP